MTHDLLYFEDDIAGLEVTEYELQALGFATERDWDDIHRHRLSIDGAMDETDYYVYVMEHGLYGCSFAIELLRMSDVERLLPAFELFKQRNPKAPA